MVADPSMRYVSDFYAGYGNLVGTFTPTSVTLPISLGEIQMLDDGNPVAAIFIRSPARDRKDEPAQFVAGFAAPIEVSYVPVPIGLYDRLELRFSPGHALNIGRDGSVEDTYTTWCRNSIVVELPGYGGLLDAVPSTTPLEATSPDQSVLQNGDFFYDLSMTFPDSTEEQFLKAYDELKRRTFIPAEGTYFERKNESGDVYSFTMQYLYPMKTPSALTYRNGAEAFQVQAHVLSDKVTAARIASAEETVFGGASILLPFTPIEIRSSGDRATVTVAFDVTGLIAVYDNGTPGEKSDDIIVLADAYWERFSVSLSYGG